MAGFYLVKSTLHYKVKNNISHPAQSKAFAANKDSLKKVLHAFEPAFLPDPPCRRIGVLILQRSKCLNIAPIFHHKPTINMSIRAIPPCIGVLFLFSCHSEPKQPAAKETTHTELTPQVVVEQFISYELSALQKKKNEAGSEFYADKEYIKGFWYRKEKGDNDDSSSLTIEFYPTYANYTRKWKEDNEWKLTHCVGSYEFQFDESKISKENEYTRSAILKTDLNDDGKVDYIVDGYFHDCSGGSGSEATYVLTFMTTGNGLRLTDIIYGLGDFKLNGNKMIFSGQYKALADFKIVHDFDPNTGKWKKNESQSYWNRL